MIITDVILITGVKSDFGVDNGACGCLWFIMQIVMTTQVKQINDESDDTCGRSSTSLSDDNNDGGSWNWMELFCAIEQLNMH